MSFRREKFIPKGGPDGGDGGDGGDVVLVGDSSLDTLLTLTHRPHYRAENGKPGMGKQMHGANGDSRVVQVPLGTLVYDEDNHLLADIAEEGQELIVARGGKGGFGNEHFKSSTNQAPRESTPGGEWEDRTLRLELKLLADVGLVGLPNAGKSTFLTAVSAARPKVADYPFTTLHPHLGIAVLDDERRLVVADIPGLIEGAADGAGLGHDFLRHIERTSVLLHLIDLMPVDGSDPVTNAKTIEGELRQYSEVLEGKPILMVGNKIDLIPEDERPALIAAVADALGLTSLPTCSGATHEGVAEVLRLCWSLVGKGTVAGW